MAYPYYYPYFSARNVVPSSISKLQSEISALKRQQLLRERTQIQLTVLRKQQELNTKRIRQYEEELRVKQTLNDQCQQERINAQVNASKCRQKAYENQLRKMKNQHHLRNINRFGNERSRLQNQKSYQTRYEHNSTNSQGQKINLRVIQQYQQELLRKLQSNKQNIPKNQKNYVSKQQKNTNPQLRQSEKTFLKSNEDHVLQTRKRQREKSISFSNPVIMNKINKSSINHDKQERCFSTLDANKQKKHKRKDRIKQEHHQGYFSCQKNIYNHQTALRNAKNASKKQRQCRKSLESKNRSELLQLQESALANNGLKRIENRLKLAAIVFKDVKCKNRRYEIGHLFNTYEAEIRLRKEVKDKLNNHPTIIKKHNLVVTSR